MGNSQYNYESVTQNVFTDVLNVSTQECKGTCNQSTSGNVVIIEGGNIQGDVNILNNSCTVDAKCLMNNTVTTDISNIVSATLSQKNAAATSWFSGFSGQTNIAVSSQNISNYITQMLVSTCQADSWQSQNSNFLYFGDNANNLIALNNNGDVSASCTMSNLAKISVSNQATAQVTQSNVAVGGFILFAIILIIICIIVIFTSRKKGGDSGSNLQDLENLLALQALK